MTNTTAIKMLHIKREEKNQIIMSQRILSLADAICFAPAICVLQLSATFISFVSMRSTKTIVARGLCI